MTPAKTSFSRRLGVLFLIALLAFSCLIARLFFVQVLWGGQLRQEATKIRTRDIILQPNRGNIYDRQHNPLVTSIPSYSIYTHPDQIKDPGSVADKVTAILGIRREEIYEKLAARGPFVWLQHGVEFDRAKKLQGISGLGFIESSTRFYKQGNLAAALLGFVGDDNQGLNGLEKSYDRELRGSPGKMVLEIDAQGRQIPQSAVLVKRSEAGNNLVLTLDQTIQYYVERELDRIVSAYQPKWAVILVMDPKTGEILAMGNRPTFDPSRWRKFPREVWEKNPVTLYTYEPGSTFKMITAAAALEEGVVRPTDWFNDPGYAVVNGRRIYCWDRKGHGLQSFAQAVGNSCNPVFIQVGLKLGKERFFKYVRGFGFGTPTNIDLPGEESGVVLPEERASELDIATMAIGQSIAVTPIQLLTAVSAIANGGYLMQPHVVRAVEDASGKTIREITPRVIRQVISTETARQLSGLLEKVVLEGTGKRALVEGYRVAGKTGTAQVPGPGGYVEGKYVASFAGFAPADNPRIAVLVVVGEPRGQEYHGGEVAAPAFGAVVRDTLRYLGVPEDPSRESQDVPPEQDELVVVPNVVGFPVREALWLLQERGLRSWSPGKTGLVTGQEPPAGKRVPPGTTVSLQIVTGKAPEQLVVPDLSGLTVKKAGSILEELGLKFKASGSGVAVRQRPEAGSRVAPGTTVFVEFAPP
ncbi:penicillin-binding transpeptidase domain-containing protein [Desulfofundulus thermosubterraneus]|uniref:Stage V sporulation protein D (Sporulation-specific penicillin-binding protein) n=1 Tax=Desulfofundulus thermosubterraneus DSM 16057 TaxID=1121432 RepID=A0A1M6BAJ0_9FIRM|nr:penicillin-binding transpeptidase domain-containing protein [Desulfofundulus thermosubterraneus]SHI45725.1 stage V sporulation protein D (sporulation-specific penicillin-binding protein) [Desulfofundulus thermosubterraneus DSM 16057]